LACLENNRNNFDKVVLEIDNKNINIHEGIQAFSDVIYKCLSMIFGETITKNGLAYNKKTEIVGLIRNVGIIKHFFK
jgi:hypothetical protein